MTEERPAAHDLEGLVRPELAAMAGYTPVEPADVLRQRAAGPVERVIKLDGNENPYGCSPRVYQALAAYASYHHYPDPEQRELREALEGYAGVDRRHIVCGMGSDDLIDLILRLFLSPGDEVINCPPTFGMYPFSTGVCGGRVIDVPRGDDFSIDVDGIKDALGPRAKVIFIASPNNPSGDVVSETQIADLIDTGRIVVIDEAYFEFSNTTCAPMVPLNPNLVVLRTFSKWAGLAGLRIGYGVFPEWMAGYIMKIKQPYNVSAAAQVSVLASLADIEQLRGNVARIVAERDRLFSQLQNLGWLRPYRSRGNFILCRVLTGKARELWLGLRARGISVRYFDDPRIRDCVRISVGTPEDTDALIEALKKTG